MHFLLRSSPVPILTLRITDEVTNQNFEPTKENLDRLVLPVYTDLGWEFAMEGHRRQDLIRFGVFTRKSWFTKESGRPCQTVFPIPENALEENPNLEQHPCYK